MSVCMCMNKCDLYIYIYAYLIFIIYIYIDIYPYGRELLQEFFLASVGICFFLGAGGIPRSL